MKVAKLLVATVLFTSLATLSYAGPSPQFWAQQAKNQQAQKAKVDAQAKAQPATQVAACANCSGCSCAALKKS
jgi:hypothetical protein